MRSLKIVFFGKIPLVIHRAQGDVQLKPLDVAYVPGLQVNFFSLHAVMPMHQVTFKAEGEHLLDGDLSFLRRDAGSYVAATRIVEPVATEESPAPSPPPPPPALSPGTPESPEDPLYGVTAAATVTTAAVTVAATATVVIATTAAAVAAVTTTGAVTAAASTVTTATVAAAVAVIATAVATTGKAAAITIAAAAAATGTAACCPGAECLYPWPGGRRCAEG